MSDIAWRDFGKIENCQRLQKYLDGREYGHNDYCHYSTLKVLNNILASREIWLSPVSGFNDAEDSRVFKEREKEHYYSFVLLQAKMKICRCGICMPQWTNVISVINAI